MPAKVKSRSKSRSKSKKPKTPRATSRLNQTLPATQIEKPIKTQKRLARLNRVLKIESPLKPPLEASTPQRKLLKRQPSRKERVSGSKESSQSRGSDIAPLRPKERKVKGRPKKHSSRSKEQLKKVTAKERSKKSKQLSRSSLSSASKDGLRSSHHLNANEKKPSAQAKIGKNIPSQEVVQVQRPFKFDKAAFFLKQAQTRIGNLLSNYEFSKLRGLKLGFRKKILYTLEFENKEGGRKVAEDFCSSEIRVLGKILNMDLELMFLSGFIEARSR